MPRRLRKPWLVIRFLGYNNSLNKKDAAITGSVVIEEDNRVFNRMLFVFPDGKIVHYDKKHTFTLAGENNVYTAGEKQVIVNYKGWKICPLVWISKPIG